MRILKVFILLCFACGIAPAMSNMAKAQSSEDAEVLVQGRRYLDLNIRALDKYNRRIERKQQALLSKLKRKERRFRQKLKAKDSAAFARYNMQKLSFNSIAVLATADSAARQRRILPGSNRTIDSLQGVASFIGKVSGKAEGLSGKEDIAGYTSKLSSLKADLSYREYINKLIEKRASELKAWGNGKVPGIGGMEKQLYYAKAQLKAYKGIAEEPGRLEEKAYEYLQGQAGFEEGVDKAVNGQSPLSVSGGSLTAADLEKMGYQTRRQLNASLQQKFGGNIGAVQQQMGSQISSWQKDVQGATAQLKDAQGTVKETKQTVRKLKNTAKPSFKINPMRCQPFWQRIEKSYDFQTSRPAADGSPAMLQLGAMAAYRQSPRLSAGLGIAASFGLGQSWSQIHLSFEGVGFRSFAAYQLIYGIGAYAGYERMYKRTTFSTAKTDAPIVPSEHNSNSYSESALLGLTKSFRINSKLNGSFQLLYDFWWREKGLSSPLIIRFSNSNRR